MQGLTNLSIYIAWTTFQRRQVSMADSIHIKCIFLPIKTRSRVVKGVFYIFMLVKTILVLREERPEIVWVQLPQVPALWAALIYKALSPIRVKIVADCHNAQLQAPWCRFPFALCSLTQADAILVHNESMLKRAEAIGYPMEKVLVLEDVPAVGKDKSSIGIAAKNISAPKPWIVFPGSFAADEPIQEILEAARIASECTFIITGKLERARKFGHNVDDLPKNVVLTGYLSIEIFDDLLREANVVIGLTRVEGIQLSVCNEALGFGRPLVISDTQILRKLFGDAAVLVKTSDPISIVAGCREALMHADEYARKSRILSIDRIAHWKSEPLRDLYLMLKR